MMWMLIGILHANKELKIKDQIGDQGRDLGIRDWEFGLAIMDEYCIGDLDWNLDFRQRILKFSYLE